MSAPTTTDPVLRWLERREAINRANAQFSTGPRTPTGKRRSSLNAISHGLTAAFPVLATEDPAAYQSHVQQFRDEYHPATPTETQLVQELADIAWRLNRIPKLEAGLLDRAANPSTEHEEISFDVIDAHRTLATLGLHGSRLSRQFQKTLTTLRELQAERRQHEERNLARAAALLEMHKHKGLPYDPAQDGFVFSNDQIAAHAKHLARLNESRHFEHVLFHMPPPRHREAFSVASSMSV